MLSSQFMGYNTDWNWVNTYHKKRRNNCLFEPAGEKGKWRIKKFSKTAWVTFSTITAHRAETVEAKEIYLTEAGNWSTINTGDWCHTCILV